MLQLTDREWQEFKVVDLFNYKRGNQNNMHSLIIGKEMLVSAKNTNNGLKGFYQSNNDKKSLYKGNCITFNNDGDGGVGLAYYQPYRFLLDSHVYALYSKIELNKYINIFISQVLSKQRVCFSHGRSISIDRLKKIKIMLPTNINGNPDYTFMGAYVKEQEIRKKQEYITYAKKTLSKLQYKKIPFLKEKEWGEFFISDICNIESGQDIYDAERTVGKTPYITSTAQNNGVKYFIGNSNKTLESGAISVNRNGSVGYSFYHKYKALYSNDCRKLRLIVGNNEFISLFITNQIAQQKEKYNYGYKMGTSRLKRQKILVPIDESCKPDYAYMEQYSKNIMHTKLSTYLKYTTSKQEV